MQRSLDAATPFLLAEIVDDLIERLRFVQLEPGKALIIGDWSGEVAKFLERIGWQVEQSDLGQVDEEVPYPSSDYKLIIHLMGLGHVNDLPGALLHIRAALADGGLFLGAFAGAGSLSALRQITLAADADYPAPRCHPLVDKQASAGLLQRAGFQRQVVDSHMLSASYSNLAKLISDLRDHGLTNSLRVQAPHFTRKALERAKAQFTELAGQNGRVTESFELLTLTGWK